MTSVTAAVCGEAQAYDVPRERRAPQTTTTLTSEPDQQEGRHQERRTDRPGLEADQGGQPDDRRTAPGVASTEVCARVDALDNTPGPATHESVAQRAVAACRIARTAP